MKGAEIRDAIRDIYDRFKIPPNLRLHMLRTASVAEMLCDNWHGTAINKEDIIAACLLHDLGNIAKFDLGETDAHLLGEEAKRIDYWRKVKTETMGKYGSSEYDATRNMMKELGVSSKVVSLVDRMIYVLRNPEEAHDYELMLCEYADERVSPKGVLSVAERFAEFAERNSKSISATNRARVAIVTSLLRNALDVESRIFANMGIKPEQINDESIKPYLDRYTKHK